MNFSKLHLNPDQEKLVGSFSHSHYLFGGLDKNIFSKYIGRVQLNESDKEVKDIIYSKEEAHIFKKAKVFKKIEVFNPEEECYHEGIKSIEEKIRAQFRV